MSSHPLFPIKVLVIVKKDTQMPDAARTINFINAFLLKWELERSKTIKKQLNNAMI